jgi:isoleucyl-tRNA synthetase
MYAEVDGWEFDPSKPYNISPDELTNPLDVWVVSRVHQLNDHVTKNMNVYNLPDAMSAILPFIEDASNWYVRRSRRRFWKSGDDTDKNDAYKTLHYVLLKLSMILAPFTPFLAEELYQKLTGGESVHLLDWPKTGHVNDLMVEEMAKLRGYVNEGLGLRAQNKLKVRQPLQSVSIPVNGTIFSFDEILKEELNVKEVKIGDMALDLTVTPELKREGLMREVIRFVQNARKDAGLNVDDRISLSLTTQDSDLQKAIEEHLEEIKSETLAQEFGDVSEGFKKAVQVEGQELVVQLKKAV